MPTMSIRYLSFIRVSAVVRREFGPFLKNARLYLVIQRKKCPRSILGGRVKMGCAALEKNAPRTNR